MNLYHQVARLGLCRHHHYRHLVSDPVLVELVDHQALQALVPYNTSSIVCSRDPDTIPYTCHPSTSQ